MTASRDMRTTFLGVLLLASAQHLALAVGDGPGPTDQVIKTSFDLGSVDVHPTWSNGALLVITRNRTASPVVHVIDRQGTESTAVSVLIPGADRISLTGVGRAPDGVITVGGFSWTPDGREATFIAIVSADGTKQDTIRTYPYTPYSLTVAPDGSIWTAGLEMFNRSEKDPRIDPNYGMLRHLDRSGRLVATFIPRTSLPTVALGVPEGHVFATNDRVGWIWGNTYCEVTASGQLKRLQIPSGDPAMVVLTPSGGTVVGMRESDSQLYALTAGKWAPVTLEPGVVTSSTVYLYGADDDNLVLRDGANRSTFKICGWK